MAEVDTLRARLGWPTVGVPALGLHVRRGDAATAQPDGGVPSKATRQSFSLETYLAQADEICSARGISHVFMATESADELARARRLRPQYVFLAVDHDRSVFPDLAVSQQFIEDMAFEHPERIPALVRSAVLDLQCFSHCDAFIGTFNSEFSVLAWLLVVGARGHLVPYFSLSQPLSRRSLDPYEALLNVRNNCPLELYHW